MLLPAWTASSDGQEKKGEEKRRLANRETTAHRYPCLPSLLARIVLGSPRAQEPATWQAGKQGRKRIHCYLSFANLISNETSKVSTCFPGKMQISEF